MTDEPTVEPPTETPEETPAAPKAKRIVRRIIDAPTPGQLAEAREKRLHETLLANSRNIHDKLVVWEGDADLEVGLVLETDFDGKLLAKHYRSKGWPLCVYAREVDPAPEGVPLQGAKLVFSVSDTPPEPDQKPTKPARKASKKSTGGGK